MKMPRFAQFVLAAILATSLHSSSYAFMVSPIEESVTRIDLDEMVKSFREEIAAGETKCTDMLEKLDAALEQIDDRLDEGVTNEDEHLDARDAIVEMRFGLDCLAQKLTQVSSGGGGSMISMGGASGFSGGAISGGAGGAAAGGGGSLGGLLTAGLAAGAIIPSVANNSDSPGFVASPSTTN